MLNVSLQSAKRNDGLFSKYTFSEITGEMEAVSNVMNKVVSTMDDGDQNDYFKVINDVLAQRIDQRYNKPAQTGGKGLLDFIGSEYAGDLATGLLAQSGYSPMPTNLGSSVGKAMQFADRNIRSNTIVPGMTMTPLQKRWENDKEAGMAIKFPMQIGTGLTCQT